MTMEATPDTQRQEPEFEHFAAYAVGLVHASVCTTLGDEEATRRLNWQHPTGVGPWQIAPDPTFADGQANPHPCERGQGRHVLYVC